jgi:hypothetical protein
MAAIPWAVNRYNVIFNSCEERVMKVQCYLHTRRVEAVNTHVQIPADANEYKAPQALQLARQGAGALMSTLSPKPLMSEKHPKGLNMVEEGVGANDTVMNDLINNDDENAEQDLRISLGEMVTDAFKWRFDPQSLSGSTRH